MLDYSQYLQQVHWLAAEDAQLADLTQEQRNWLLLNDSLTAKLSQKFGEIAVEIVAEYWTADISSSEKRLFDCADQRFYCREVILSRQQNSLIFARTLFPEQTWLQFSPLQQLGNRALGEWLFKQPQRNRKCLQWSNANPYYARRSLIEVAGFPLMIAELFLQQQIFSKANNEEK